MGKVREELWPRHSQPPRHPGINRDHPLAPFVLEYTQIGPTGLQTLTGRNSAQLGSTAVQPTSSKSGIGRRSAQTSSTQYEQAGIDLTAWPSAFTLYARVSVGTTAGDAGTSTSTARYIYSLWSTTGAAVGFGCPGSGLINAVSSIGAGRVNANISVTAGQEYDVFLSHTGGTAGLTLEVLGVSSNTSSTVTQSVTVTAPYVQAGANISTSAPGDKSVFYGGFFKKVLSDAERRLLADNPAALFNPISIWVPQAGITGLPTLSASTYKPGTLTSGGWQARITSS